jgi:hypothetical protein
MHLNEEDLLDFRACEAFLRRAATVDMPFMLKGSFLTRQYFHNPNDRSPADLDWVYLLPINGVAASRAVFDAWVTQVTETKEHDGIHFDSFSTNAFWRRIDYAMADDFPTVNTDLHYSTANTAENWISLDISFNLDVETAPVPLLYHPQQGKPFLLPRTTPLPLQVSWKLHQSLVRPRLKDFFDLTHILFHPSFDDMARSQCLQALVNECSADNTPLEKLAWLLSEKEDKLFHPTGIQAEWEVWRFDMTNYDVLNYGDRAQHITNKRLLPDSVHDFLEQFRAALQHAGLTPDLYRHLPAATRHHRTAIIQQQTFTQEQALPKQKGIRRFFRKWLGRN